MFVSTTYKRIAVSDLNGQKCTVDSNEIDVIIQPALVPGVAITEQQQFVLEEILQI